MYVLTKGEIPELKVAEVVSVSSPTPKFPTSYTPNPNVDMVVCIKVRVDGEDVEYKNVPANASIADFGNGIIISESSQAMLAEVENLERQSKAILASVDYHKKAVESYEAMRKELCPQYAKEQLQEERIDRLENGLKDIKELLTQALSTKKPNYENDHN